MAKIPAGVGPQYPQVVVLFGATGDLARRKLLPGLFHLANSGFIPGCRIIGVSLEDLNAEGFARWTREALKEFSTRKVTDGGLGRLRREPGLRADGRGRDRPQGGRRGAEKAFGGREPPAALPERPAERRPVRGADAG